MRTRSALKSIAQKVALIGFLAACNGRPVEEIPVGPFEAGVAQARMPTPLGIGTAGFNGLGVGGAPVSPYSDLFPATQRLHGHPEFKVVVLSRGEGHELVFVRGDFVGVFQQLRQAVVDEVKRRSGRDLDDALIFGATHTHSGPGRIVSGGGLFDVIADSFMPAFYQRLIDTLAGAILAAYDDLEPASVSWGQGDAPEGHDDRRCEDGEDYKNSAIPFVAIERDGQIDALIVSYAVHGTIMNNSEFTLGQDVSGAIEQSIENRFDHPVEVLFFNSWGADMAPSSPVVDDLGGGVMPHGYERMEAIGQVVADDLMPQLEGLTWLSEPTIGVQGHRFEINEAALSYDPGVFDYQYGGTYCALEGDNGECDGAVYDAIGGCLPFTEEFPAPKDTLISTGQIGDLHFITFPGEPGTRLAESILERVAFNDGVSEMIFFGYTQDYLGYSILEEDWWHGGYESTGAIWGPRQGAYLADRAVESFHRYKTPESDPLDGVFPPAAPEIGTVQPWTLTQPVDLGQIVQDVQSLYRQSDLIQFEISGSDPWLLTPLATLMHADGRPVLRPNGSPMNSDDYSFWVELRVEPAYEVEASARQFIWSYHLAARHNVVGEPVLSGDYTLSVSLPNEDGTSTLVESQVFTVSAN